MPPQFGIDGDEVRVVPLDELTWLYNESRGSILVVAVFHATVDVAFTSSIASSSVSNIVGALVTLWGVIVLLVAGPRYLSKRGKVVRPAGNGGITGFVDRRGQFGMPDA